MNLPYSNFLRQKFLFCSADEPALLRAFCSLSIIVLINPDSTNPAIVNLLNELQSSAEAGVKFSWSTPIVSLATPDSLTVDVVEIEVVEVKLDTLLFGALCSIEVPIGDLTLVKLPKRLFLATLLVVLRRTQPFIPLWRFTFQKLLYSTVK